jgi:RecB family endonuclease NucS
MKRFLVVIPKPDGGVEVHAMKQWLRQHPDQLPPGFDATTSTSHQLRGALKRTGWSIDENDSEVRLVPPGSGVVEANVSAVLGGGGEQEDAPEEPDAQFGLEYQLRDFLAENIQRLDVDGRRLRLYVDPSGADGIEYPTAVGRIDLLAVDDAGAFFVFELKRARSPDHAMGQLTRYMGWVRQTIGRDRPVNGVIVAKEISDALRYAVSVVPNVRLFEYDVEFTLRPAHEIVP